MVEADVRHRSNVTVTGDADGPVVVLAHGFGCDQSMWRLVVPRLAGRYKVVLFDYVGSGRSDPSAWVPERYASLDGYAQDVVDVLRALDLRRVTFVGHSVSAMAGVLAARTAPERIGSLVMVSPPRATSTTTGTAAASHRPTSRNCWPRWTRTTSAGRPRWHR
ncbi:alpha/beta fold hydrolase [Streptomyces sp. NPDC085944]|uniref:alpha/beta fold hydrolase n=1 Tax=Streptomyces sp. NPDC085944 TaxID=3154962 RepID=UPI0034332EE8